MEDIEKQIVHISTKLTEIDLATKRNIIVRHMIEDLLLDLDIKKLKMNEEYQDIERLNKINTKTLFHTILGDLDEAKNKEKEEYLLAVLDYNNTANKIDLLQFEYGVLSAKISKKSNWEVKLLHLLDQKEKLLLERGDHFSSTYKRFTEKESALNLIKVEIDEAILVTNELIDTLKAFKSYISEAEPWTMYLGETYLMKQKHKNARLMISQIDQIEEKLNAELADLNQNLNIEVNLSPTIRFMTSIYSALIDDWSKESYLENARKNVQKNINNANELKNHLADELTNIELQVKKLKDEKRFYLLHL